MEFQEGEVEPPSTLMLLRQQIDEQSEYCDVTIKAGEWSKKFHRCILAASPFFDAVFRNKHFKEQSTGIIELQDQHPHNIVEDAILFLYEQKPKITIGNIHGLFAMAEFLLIPTLKAQCAKWLENVEFSYENCFQILHIANIFDVYIPYFEQFIEENLLDLLDDAEAVTLYSETIVELLTDTDLFYVPVKQWFSFLVRWTRTYPMREEYFANLFSLLDVSDIDEGLCQEILNEPFVAKLGTSVLEAIKPSLSQTTQVVIFPAISYVLHNAYFLVDNGRWCRISENLSRIKSVEDKTSPIVYEQAGSNKISIIDLSCEKEIKTELIYRNTAQASDLNVNTVIVKSTCYTIVREKAIKPFKPSKFTAQHIRFNAMLGIEPEVTMRALRSSVRHHDTKYTNVINLYRGDLQEGRTLMEPLVCFLEDVCISNIAVDRKGNIAMVVQGNGEVIIYNEKEGFVERLNFRQFPGYRNIKVSKFTARDCGFVLMNETHILCISAVHGLKEKFELTMVSLDRRYKYIVCGDLYFRFCSRFDYGSTFSYINVNNLKEAMTDDTEWVKVDLSETDNEVLDDYIGTSAFMITLPKQMLRCALNCRHCGDIYIFDDDPFPYYSDYSDHYDNSD